MSKGLQKLKAKAPARRFRSTASPLFRWMTMNQEEIRLLFSNGPVAWSEVIDAAREDGIEVENTVHEQRSCSRKWSLMTAKRDAIDSSDGEHKPGQGKQAVPTSTRPKAKAEPDDALPQGRLEGSSTLPSAEAPPAPPEPDRADQNTLHAVAGTSPTLSSGRKTETPEERDARVEAQRQRAIRMVRESLARRGGEPVKD